MSNTNIQIVNETNTNVDFKEQLNYMLAQACSNGFFEMAQKLVEMGADVTSYDNSCVRLAAESGKQDIVKYLVDRGADASIGISFAAYNNDYKMVKYLVENSKNLNDTYDIYNYPLKYACVNSNVKMVKVLIRAGFDVNYGNGLAIFDAINNRKDESSVLKIIKMLFVAGYNQIPNYISQTDKDNYDYNYSLLELALNRNYNRVIKFLFEHGYCMTVDEQQESITRIVTNENVEMLKFLLKYGLNIRFAPKDIILHAIKKSNYELTKILVENGAHKPKRALIMACEYGNEDIIELLLNVGYDPKYEKNASVILASMHSSEKAVKLLIDKGANIRARRNMALKMAVKYSNASMVEFLIDNGANPYAISKKEINSIVRRGHGKKAIIISKARKNFFKRLFN